MTKNLKYGVIALMGVICISATVGGSFVSETRVEARRLTLVSDVFETVNVDVEPHVSDPNATVNDLGVLLSFDEGGEVKLRGEYSGEFTIEYLPLYGERSYTYKTLQVTFSDVESEANFSFNVYNGTLFNGSVTLEGNEAGIYYIGNTTAGLTRLMNLNKVYTQFSASSAINLRFDPITMCVYIGDSSQEYLVWDLKNSINDGKDIAHVLSDFEKYTVELSFEDVSVGEVGQAIIYKINNCAFDGIVFDEVGAPVIGCSLKENALVGEKYELPQVFGFDVVDGQLEVACELYAPDGERIRMVDGAVIPSIAGEYTLKTTAENSFGITAEKSFAFYAYDNVPSYELVFDASLEDTHYVGERIYVPTGSISGGLNVEGYTKNAKLTVYRNNVKMKAYDDVYGGFYYTLNGSGTYKFVYGVYDTEKTLEIDVEEKLVDFKTDVADWAYQGAVLDFRAAKAYINGEECEYSFEVEYPNGYVYSNKKFETSIAGVYVVKISVEYEGRIVVEEKEIRVYQAATDLFDGGKDSEIGFGTSTFNGKEGIKITPKKGRAEVTYQKEIDISRYVNQTKQNEDGITVLSDSAIPLIELSVDTTKYNTECTDYLYVYLTDAEDPSNRIEIKMGGSHEYLTYIRASAGSQGLSGFDNSSAEKATHKLNNAYGKLWYDRYGFSVAHSLFGAARSSNPANESSIMLYYDNEKKQLLSKPNSYTNCIVTDFDDRNYCNGEEWSGFTSGKVILSVRYGVINLKNIVTGNTYYIHQIDGAELKDPVLLYEDAPTIQVLNDFELFGLKGQYCEIPSVKAFDCYNNSIENIIHKVYYVDNGKYYDVTLKDGRFFAKYSGQYVVRYFAIDGFENIQTKDVTVEVLDSAEELKGGIVDLPAEYLQGTIYERVKILTEDQLEITNAVGNYQINLAVYLQDDPENSLSIFNGGCIPEKFGKYVVEYTITDAVNRQCKIAYTFDVERTEDYVIVGNEPTYVGFAYGNNYELTDIYVQDFSKSDAPIEKSDIYVNGELCSNNLLFLVRRVEEENAEEVVDSILIEYKYGGTVIKSFNLPVKTVLKEKTRQVGVQTVSQSQVKMERFFVLDSGMSVEPTNDSLIFTSDSSSACAEFIQKVYSGKFELSFDIAEDRTLDLAAIDTNIKEVKIKMIDACDINKELQLKFSADENGKVRLFVNGYLASDTVQERFDGTISNDFAFKYDNTDYTLSDGTGARYCKISTYADGEKFEGFGEYIYVSFGLTLRDENKSASLKLFTINNHAFSNLVSDSVNPTIVTDGDCTGFYNAGERIATPTAKAYDVLSNIESLTLTVEYTDPRGTTAIAKDVNGVSLKDVSPYLSYNVKLDHVGTYRVIYTAKDSYGNGAYTSKVFVATVRSTTVPVIELTSKMPNSLKFNQTNKIADYKVSFGIEHDDNATYVLYISPSNQYQLIKEGSFIPMEKGIYMIRYIAIDAYGNSATFDYKIRCE